MKYKVINVSYNEDTKEDIRKVRSDVFIKEQGIDPEIEFDGKDESAVHSLVFYETTPVGTGRILDDGRIGRVSVLKQFRHEGFGLMIMKSLINEAKIKGFSRVYLDSQKCAVEFYEKLGFSKQGSSFVKANIEHQTMEMPLD